MIKAGIAGAAGYTGGELLRILIHHPEVEIVWAHSNSQAGMPWAKSHYDLAALTKRTFDSKHNLNNIDVLFLCMGHGDSKKFVEANDIPASVKIIDLSQDFRNGEDSSYIYGLPELNRDHIKQAEKVANPGCFATAIQLSLLPFMPEIQYEVHITAITGSTGAGVGLSETSHFSYRDNNLSIYKAFNHQHLKEISRHTGSLGNSNIDFNFVPMRGPFTRGILASVYFKSSRSLESAISLAEKYYAKHPFTKVWQQGELHIKQVVNTNNCLLQVQKHNGYLHITSVIDNLCKGASGQAVQNMNLMFSLPEDCGLNLKSNAF